MKLRRESCGCVLVTVSVDSPGRLRCRGLAVIGEVEARLWTSERRSRLRRSTSEYTHPGSRPRLTHAEHGSSELHRIFEDLHAKQACADTVSTTSEANQDRLQSLALDDRWRSSGLVLGRGIVRRRYAKKSDVGLLPSGRYPRLRAQGPGVPES